MPKGRQVEGMTPGTNEQYYLAGALDLGIGILHQGLGPRNTKGLLPFASATSSSSQVAPKPARRNVCPMSSIWLSCRPAVGSLTAMGGPHVREKIASRSGRYSKNTPP
jgi:hypothetical protein